MDTAKEPSAPGTRRRSVLSGLWRYGAAALAGVLQYAAFAPRHLWWAAILSFALLWWALAGVRVRRAALQGLLFGAGLLLPLLSWLQQFLGSELGPTPWLALSLVMALFPAAACALVPLVARLPAAPLWAALLFVAAESGTSRFPSDGFPWGRVAFGQTDGPFLPLAAIGGAPLVTFAVVATGFALAALAAQPREVRRAVVVAVLVAGTAIVPSPPVAAQAGTRTVALVQGNAPDIGLELEDARDTLEANTLRGTAGLAAGIRAGSVARPDFVVWPETVTATAGSDPAVDQAVAALGVPVLVGAITEGSGDGSGARAQNSVIVWDPVTGAGASYAKQKLVPFGEYTPLRSIASLVTPFADAPDLLPGTRTGVLDIAGTRVGVGVCYEVAYDQILRDATAAGAQLLVVPTNNAWYGRSEMSDQQLAMARLRAVENGRAVVVAAVSGVSAVVEPDGTVTRSTDLFTAANVVATVPLRTDRTVATGWGGLIELLLCAAALLGCGAGLRTARHRRT